MDASDYRDFTAVLDVDELTERCLGHLDFLERILAKFQKHFAQDLDLLAEGVEAEDAERIAQVAHRLKGAAANVAAAGLRDQAAEIERLGRAGRLPEIRPRVAGIRDDWKRFVEEVASLDLHGAAR